MAVVPAGANSVQFFSDMERRGQQCSKGKHPPPLRPPHRMREERWQTSSGSFSASLLDAMYRSLDEGHPADVVVDAPRRPSEEKATATAQFWWATEAGKPRQDADRAERRRQETGVARPRHSGYALSTTSSSDWSSSSSNGFSCSSASTTDTEPTVRRRHSPPPPRVSEESSVASADVADAQPKGKRKSKSRACFPGASFRPRSPSQSSPGPQPTSPTTFACALKALFTSVRLQWKPKTPAVVPRPSGVPPVEELVRGLEEVEEDEEGSDSSSNLFELESFRGAGADELPVYGTTKFAANRAISERVAC